LRGERATYTNAFCQLDDHDNEPKTNEDQNFFSSAHKTSWRSRRLIALSESPSLDRAIRCTEKSARIKVTAGHVGWPTSSSAWSKNTPIAFANISQPSSRTKPLIILRIPTTIRLMDPVLIDLLRAELGQHLGVVARDERIPPVLLHAPQLFCC